MAGFGDPLGPVSYRDANGGRGYSFIAEVRLVETIRDGAPVTLFLTRGDTVRSRMKDENGRTILGAIDQTVGSAK